MKKVKKMKEKRTNTKQEQFTRVLSHGMCTLNYASITGTPFTCVVNKGTFTLARIASVRCGL